MKKWRWVLTFLILIAVASTSTADAQCSICTKTAGQLGEKPAKGINSGIIYLMLTPFAIAGYIGYRWWQGEKENEQ
jgi:hypothetical protein